MAMDLTSITPILYELYIPGLQVNIESEDFFSNMLKAAQRVENVGQNFNVKVQTGFSEGISMSPSATAALPDAGQCQYQEYRGTTRSIDAHIRIYRKLVDMTNGFQKGALNILDGEMRGVEGALKSENERMVISDGGVTPIAVVASATVSTESDTWVTVTVDDGGGIALCGSRWPTRYFRRGMFIDILAANHTSVSSTATESLEILTIASGTVIKIKCATNAAADTLAALLADGQLIYHQNGYNAEFEGIKSLFGDTDNQLWGSSDADRAVTNNEHLIPFVVRVNATGLIESGAATGTPKDWSILNVVETLDHLQNVNKAKLADLVMLAEKSILNRYITMKQASGMYTVESATIEGWPFQTVMCEGVKLTAPPYMFSNAISIVPIKKMMKFKCRDIDFVSEFGGIWQKVPGYDAAEAYLSGTLQYGCENFQHGGTIYDLKGAYDA
jgi:hypothetical protein